MPRYYLWDRNIGADRRRGIKLSDTIMANDIKEASVKARDRTGRRPLLITDDNYHIDEDGGPLVMGYMKEGNQYVKRIKVHILDYMDRSVRQL